MTRRTNPSAFAHFGTPDTLQNTASSRTWPKSAFGSNVTRTGSRILGKNTA